MNQPAGLPALSAVSVRDKGWSTSDKALMLEVAQWAAKGVALAFAYYLLAVLTLKLRFSASTLSLVWPSNALLIAALVLSPKRYWWLPLLIVVPAHIAALSSYHVGAWWLAFQITVNSALAVMCAAILQRFKPVVLGFERLEGVLIFLATSVVVPALVSFAAVYPVLRFAPSTVLAAHGWTSNFGALWTARWITNSTSIMVFTPTFLLLMSRGVDLFRNLSARRVGEAVLLTLLLAAVTFQAYGRVYTMSEVPPTIYLIPIPFLIWAAVRFGPAGACLSVTAFVCLSSWCAYIGEGPFLRSVAVDHMTILQMCWMAISAPLFCLAAMVRENDVALLASVENERRFRSLFTEAPIGIALEDVNGNLLLANPTLCSMLGYTKEEMTNMNCTQFADADDEEEDWKAFQAMRAGEVRSYQIEKRYRQKDGGRIWGRLNVSMLESSSGSPLVLATVEDITDKRSAHEELQRAHSELQEFAPRLLSAQEDERRRISRELHDDFGQRLSLLAMSVDVLGRKVPAERSVERAEIARIMEGLNDLVTDVHNMSHQLHSAKLEHLGLRVALNEVCRQLALQHRIAIILSADGLPEFLPEQVSLAFYRVAQEALSNAVKHSGSDRVEISLHYENDLLCMRVRDFGVGFDPDLRKSGLGLVTMQERLRMIGGVLRFNPVPEGGIELQAEAKIEAPGLDGRKIA